MSINIEDYHRLMPFLPPVSGQHLWHQDDLFIIVEENRPQGENKDNQKIKQNQTQANYFRERQNQVNKHRSSSQQNLGKQNSKANILNEERRALREKEMMAQQLQIKLQKMKSEEQKLQKYLDFNEKKTKQLIEKTKLFQEKGIDVGNILNQTQLGDSFKFDKNLGGQQQNQSTIRLKSIQNKHQRFNTEASFVSDNKNDISINSRALGEKPISIQKIEDLTKICEYKLFMKEQIDRKRSEEFKLQQKLKENYENMRERAKQRIEKQFSHKQIAQNQVKIKEQQELEEINKFKQKQEQDIQSLNKLLNDYDKKLTQQKNQIKNHGEILQNQLNLDKNSNSSRYQYNLQSNNYSKNFQTDSSFQQTNDRFFFKL